jgi:hypothetical protein
MAGLLKRRSDWAASLPTPDSLRACCRLGAPAPNRQHALLLFFGAGRGRGKRRLRSPAEKRDESGEE